MKKVFYDPRKSKQVSFKVQPKEIVNGLNLFIHGVKESEFWYVNQATILLDSLGFDWRNISQEMLDEVLEPNTKIVLSKTEQWFIRLFLQENFRGVKYFEERNAEIIKALEDIGYDSSYLVRATIGQYERAMQSRLYKAFEDHYIKVKSLVFFGEDMEISFPKLDKSLIFKATGDINKDFLEISQQLELWKLLDYSHCGYCGDFNHKDFDTCPECGKSKEVYNEERLILLKKYGKAFRLEKNSIVLNVLPYQLEDFIEKNGLEGVEIVSRRRVENKWDFTQYPSDMFPHMLNLNKIEFKDKK